MQCHLHGIVINGMKLRKDIYASGLRTSRSKFPQTSGARAQKKEVPVPSDSESDSEHPESESESDRSETDSESDGHSETDEDEIADEDECGAYLDFKLGGPCDHDSSCTCESCVHLVDEDRAYHRPSKRFRRTISLDEMQK